MPVSIEPPPPSAEQLADWQAVIERIRQGGRSRLLAWDEAEAVGTAAPYQVLVTQLVHQRLRGAPPLLDGELWGRARAADVLGSPSRADLDIARSDLGGMTQEQLGLPAAGGQVSTVWSRVAHTVRLPLVRQLWTAVGRSMATHQA
jgi:hypothetical protein